MAQLTDLPVNLRGTLLMLFRGNNYCFATSAARRSPTFYFAQGGLNALNTAMLCGRIRTEHPSGPLIDITQGAKGHYFCSTDTRRDHLARKFHRGLTRPEIAALSPRYRTTPHNRDHHFEYTKAPGQGYPYSRLHRSGGTIVLAPRLTTDTQVTAVIEKVLDGPCQIKLGQQLAFQSRSAARGPGGHSVAAYIAAL